MTRYQAAAIVTILKCSLLAMLTVGLAAFVLPINLVLSVVLLCVAALIVLFAVSTSSREPEGVRDPGLSDTGRDGSLPSMRERVRDAAREQTESRVRRET